MALTFITGPVRSGKSRFAERLALETGLPVTYIATARVDRDDAEWIGRLAHHAARRPPSWSLLETATPQGRDLAEVLRASSASVTLVVDSLGTWLADRMSFRIEHVRGTALLDPAELEVEADALCDAFAASPAHVFAVSEEVGWGIVPEHPSGRIFRDLLGRMNQRLARESSSAYLVVSGYAIDLRSAGAIPI